MNKGWFLIFGCAFLCISPCAIGENEKIWLLVDTQKQFLAIKHGKKTVKFLKNIAIGQNGAGEKKRLGDDVTPKGSYTSNWINSKSSFYRFYGFDYPSVDNAKKALANNLVTKKSYSAIINAHKKKSLPPQNTKLGGRIGIHGLGKGNKWIHERVNWTHGCIALTNEQIDILGGWISKGTQVVVK
jgi:murein L,D-transpeptidase YafK